MDKPQTLKMLIVDDEEGILDYTRKIYRNKGFVVFGATDGITAVDIFKREHPNVCLIDVHMPLSPINGIETLRRIKEIDKTSPCIMFSRIAETKEVEAARSLGANAYLLKPVEEEDMDKVITELTGIKF